MTNQTAPSAAASPGQIANSTGVATPADAAPLPAVKSAVEVAPATGQEPDTNLAALLDEPPAHSWYRRPGLWAGVALILLAVAGLWYWYMSRAANAAPSYVTQAAVRGNLTLTVTANGTIQPTRSISIGSELSGTVLKVNVDVNDQIKQGQVLVELDPAKLIDQVAGSQAALDAARGKADETAATITEAQASLARLEAVEKLSGGKVPAKTELDVARATLARAKADDASARAAVKTAQSTLSTDQINLSKASIRAPSAGVVLTRNVDPGNAVAASLQAVTLFTVAEDLKQLRLWVYVDEADVGSVKVGQDATFTVSAYPTRKYPAHITRVGFGSTITDNVVTYLTYLDVDNSDLSLRPGMTATAIITATQRKDVLIVPNSSLRFSPSVAGTDQPAASGGGIVSSLTPHMPRRGNTRGSAADSASTAAARQVWVLPAGGKDAPVSVSVTTGISDGRMTEITGGDLQAGMQVITDQKTAAAK